MNTVSTYHKLVAAHSRGELSPASRAIMLGLEGDKKRAKALEVKVDKIKKGGMYLFTKKGHKYDGCVMRVMGCYPVEPGPMSGEKSYIAYNMKRMGVRDELDRLKRGIDAKARDENLTPQCDIDRGRTIDRVTYEQAVIAGKKAGLPFAPELSDQPKPHLQGLTREFILDPCPKPRMTQRDKWLDPPRSGVARYRAFRDHLGYLAGRWELPDSFSIIFYVKMPASWSKKKRRAFEGEPHQQTPDLDNYLKATCDAFRKEDKQIWWIQAQKRWAYAGSIVITPEIEVPLSPFQRAGGEYGYAATKE